MLSRVSCTSGRFASDFIVKRKLTGSKQRPDAAIFSGNEEVAEIKKEKGDGFRLTSRKGGLEWLLSNSVHGEPRPFSFSVCKLEGKHGGDGNASQRNEIFAVRDQLFKHNGRFYMLAGHPRDRNWDERVYGAVRYINRLDGFDGDSELSQIDYDQRDVRDKTKRLRGTAVGEASGLGTEERGHCVRVDDELADVGLFIAAISYLIYAAA